MLLQQPFPAYRSSIRNLCFSAIAGGIVFIIILFFRPFGLSSIESNYFLLHALLYGVGTFVMVTVNTSLLPKIWPRLFEERRWTVGKELLMMLWQLFTISFINILITHVLYNTGFSLATLINFFAYTTAIGIFPITILVLLKYVTLLKRAQLKAGELDRQVAQTEQAVQSAAAYLQLKGDYQNEELTVLAEAVCYIATADNYIKVFYVDKEEMQVKVLRSTLKKVEQGVAAYPQFFRCHRAYIVNLNNVNKITGNAQGLKLHLKYTNEVVPVSRNLNGQLTALIEQRSGFPT